MLWKHSGFLVKQSSGSQGEFIHTYIIFEETLYESLIDFWTTFILLKKHEC